MKLEYKVLWFEDQFEYIEDDIQSICGLVREHGFIPIVERRTGITEGEIDELSHRLDSYNPYDLIIFDYDLGTASAGGLQIATKLRASIYTDMIFYSGKVPDDLRRYLYEEKVDGVFVIHRDNFFDEIEPLIEDHIKRMSDINNIRGVAMSATSSLDNSLREILISRVESKTPDDASQFLNSLKARLLKSITKQQKKIEELTCPVTAVGDHFSTNFDVVRIMLRSEFGKNSSPYLVLDNNSTIHKVQVERNNLAHQKDEYTNEGKMVLHGRDGPVEYDFEQFKRLRNELLEAVEHIEKNLV